MPIKSFCSATTKKVNFSLSNQNKEIVYEARLTAVDRDAQHVQISGQRNAGEFHAPAAVSRTPRNHGDPGFNRRGEDARIVVQYGNNRGRSSVGVRRLRGVEGSRGQQRHRDTNTGLELDIIILQKLIITFIMHTI